MTELATIFKSQIDFIQCIKHIMYIYILLLVFEMLNLTTSHPQLSKYYNMFHSITTNVKGFLSWCGVLCGVASLDEFL